MTWSTESEKFRLETSVLKRGYQMQTFGAFRDTRRRKFPLRTIELNGINCWSTALIFCDHRLRSASKNEALSVLVPLNIERKISERALEIAADEKWNFATVISRSRIAGVAAAVAVATPRLPHPLSVATCEEGWELAWRWRRRVFIYYFVFKRSEIDPNACAASWCVMKKRRLPAVAGVYGYGYVYMFVCACVCVCMCECVRVCVESRLHETHWRAVNLLKKCVNQNGVFSKRSDGEIKYCGHISQSKKGPGMAGGRGSWLQEE